MAILTTISLSILALLMVGCILSLIIIAGSGRITPFQYLYLRIFGDREAWHSYVEMNKYIDSGHFIPILGLCDFVHMQCDRDPKQKEKYTDFISHNPYYFLIFNKDNEPELCGYGTNSENYGHIIFSSFYQKLCLKMARKMGYTYADLYSMMEGDMAREEDRRLEAARKIAELESILKSLEKSQESLN